MSEYLKFDTDFLEEDSLQKNGFINNPKPLSEKKRNWKKILIIVGAVLLFGWIFFSEDSQNSNTNTDEPIQPNVDQTSSGNDQIAIGEYRCSKYNYDRAVALNPEDSDEQITAAQNSLEYRGDELDRLKNEIDSSYVNEYSSQYQINQYNETIDEYNTKLTSYKRDASSLEARIDKYNTQIEAHNSYLKDNCTPNK